MASNSFAKQLGSKAHIYVTAKIIMLYVEVW